LAWGLDGRILKWPSAAADLGVGTGCTSSAKGLHATKAPPLDPQLIELARSKGPVLRIAVPLKSYDPAWGGPGIYTEKIIKYLLQIDRRNEYILIIPRRSKRSDIPSFNDIYANVQEVHTSHRASLLWDQLVIPAAARRLSLDALFSPFQSLPAIGNFTKVMTVHGAERYAVPGILNWKGYAKWLFMEKVVLRSTDAIISVSHTMKRDFCNATGYPEDRVYTAYLGVDDDFVRVEDGAALDEVRRRYALGAPFVLFVGHLFPNKNLGNLVRAFKLISKEIPHRLVIVGGRRWKFKDDLALVESLKLEDRVQFLGFVPRRDLMLLYNMASCFVFPSLYESFGLAQLEAMACGCPVVASRTGALPEVAGDAAVFCDPQDPRSIGDAIVKLVTDPKLRERHIVKGLARARRFTWEQCARETLKALEAAAARAQSH
jgi:glycosyltransferase involved in cell wall biosynthesis